MGNPRGLNGSDVLLLINTGGGNYLIPAQKSLTQSETVSAIDMSSKDSANKRKAPGQYDSKMTLTALYLPGNSGFDSMQAAFRARSYITVIRQEPTSRVSWPAGTASGIESASAFITDMSPQFPEQAGSTINLSIEVDDGWTKL